MMQTGSQVAGFSEASSLLSGASKMAPITLAFQSQYSHSLSKFSTSSTLPAQFLQYHGASQDVYSKCCQKLDQILMDYYAVEERKQTILTICAILSIGLIPLVGILIYFSLDELFWKKQREKELRGKLQAVVDEANMNFKSHGAWLALDVSLQNNTFGVPLESYELKVISERVQLPPSNQPLASPVKLYETKTTFNKECRFFDVFLPETISQQFGLSADEWKNLISRMNAQTEESLNTFYKQITCPLYWTILISAPLLGIPFLIALPFLLIYLIVIYYVTVKPCSENAEKIQIPNIVKEQNEKVFNPKGLHLNLVAQRFGSNSLNHATVTSLQLFKQ
ncbi:hypothetical protein FDP41_007941 [Naegleria fowleri]|uniref:Uncharacterized protein n=1 Tax=Naegleria fowleri TaxID=5763 RepID=A0A6A5C8D6_NAEFO|nr:uncharacterized protein FDP41_007941 [Naegleria fowleri]KAF0984026.1 hypothetical protein FDP41_007941 [Naegleria fowleri]